MITTKLKRLSKINTDLKKQALKPITANNAEMGSIKLFKIIYMKMYNLTNQFILAPINSQLFTPVYKLTKTIDHLIEIYLLTKCWLVSTDEFL